MGGEANENACPEETMSPALELSSPAGKGASTNTKTVFESPANPDY
jgi:uncharacterized protein (DUF2345 family)